MVIRACLLRDAGPASREGLEGEAGTSWAQELPLAGSQAARRRVAAPCTCHVFARQMFSERLLCTKHSDVKTGRQT